jgi:hypothetical protein
MNQLNPNRPGGDKAPFWKRILALIGLMIVTSILSVLILGPALGAFVVPTIVVLYTIVFILDEISQHKKNR